MPCVSERQRRAMYAALAGHSSLGIPQSVAREFTKDDAEPQPEGGDLTDFEAAEAIRDNELPSPTKYGEFWLFDLRVTGTGMAYRDKIDEWAYRDPKEWTTPEFVQRCNGLPVIFQHPPDSGLTSDEFRERSIGTVVLPYVKSDEVWAIAKIFDADAAELMQSTHCSTSPGVKTSKGSEPITLENGAKVLDEGPPLVLDHLAVCEQGVWDKDGPPVGVRLDSATRKEAETMTEAEREKLEKERDDARKELEDAKARADAAEKERDEAKSRADEFEKERADAKRKDEDESERAAMEKAEKEKADAKKDAEKAKADAAAQKDIDANQAEKLDARNDSTKRLAVLEAELAQLRRQPSIEERDQIAKAHHRADNVYQMLSERAPLHLGGESPIAYRKRLANGLRKHLNDDSRWKKYDRLDSVDDSAFELIEEHIYLDAAAVAKAPPKEGELGFLREIKREENGKTYREFVGDSRVTWAPFMPATRNFVSKIKSAAEFARS